MNQLAISAVATVMALGAGAGAVSVGNTPSADPNAEVMNPMIAGTAMLPSRNIVDNVANSPEHTRLIGDLKRTGVALTLAEKGPFTVFAPTDTAFAAAGALGNNAQLAKVLDYHIVRGRLDSKTLLRLIGEGGGQAHLRTLEGGTLVAQMNGPTNIVLVDEKGQTADIAIYDIYLSNGVMQVIDKVEKPD